MFVVRLRSEAIACDHRIQSINNNYYCSLHMRSVIRQDGVLRSRYVVDLQSKQLTKKALRATKLKSLVLKYSSSQYFDSLG